MIANNGLVYSFLPVQVAEKLFASDNLEIVLKGLEETESILSKELQNPNPEFNQYVVDFCTKICDLSKGTHFKVTLTSLRIIHKLVS